MVKKIQRSWVCSTRMRASGSHQAISGASGAATATRHQPLRTNLAAPVTQYQDSPHTLDCWHTGTAGTSHHICISDLSSQHSVLGELSHVSASP